MMPEDPRHGTVAGYSAHIRGQLVPPCDPCRAAQMRYLKAWKLRHLDGTRATLPAIGTIRRVRALMRIGWPMPAIAREAGIGQGSVHRIAHGKNERVWQTVHDGVAAAFERLCMTPGPHEATARRAAAAGWAAPLAYDDLDDPNEEPKGVRGAA